MPRWQMDQAEDDVYKNSRGRDQGYYLAILQLVYGDGRIGITVTYTEVPINQNNG